MSDKGDFMYREFIKVCQSPDECDKGMLPSDCRRCGWDAVKTWRECAFQVPDEQLYPFDDVHHDSMEDEDARR